jgi:hypothetical protein
MVKHTHTKKTRISFIYANESGKKTKKKEIRNRERFLENNFVHWYLAKHYKKHLFVIFLLKKRLICL